MGRNAGDGRETRRTLFLKKIKEDREEKRWQGRGGDDEVMRVIWVAEERRRREVVEQEANNLMRDAPWEAVSDADRQMEGDEGNLERMRQEADLDDYARQWEEEMVEEIARRDQEELDALLEMNEHALPELVAGASHRNQGSSLAATQSQGEPHYGSDEEDIDSLFMDFIASQDDGAANADQDMMDMS